MFDEEKFIDYLIRLGYNLKDENFIKKLKKDLHDLSKKEIRGFNEAQTKALRDYFGINCEPKTVKNLAIYNKQGNLFTAISAKYGAFDLQNKEGFAIRYKLDKTEKPKNKLIVTRGDINLVKTHTKTEVLNIYGPATEKLLEVAKRYGIEPLPEEKYEKESVERLTKNTKRK